MQHFDPHNPQHAAVAAAASAAAPAQPATDILLNAVKSEIPITLQLQYPAAAAAAAALPQFPAVPQNCARSGIFGGELLEWHFWRSVFGDKFLEGHFC